MENEIEIDIAATFGANDSRTQRFAVYVPNKDKNGAPVSQEVWVNQALTLLSDICGGATAMPPVRGAWLNPDSQHLVIEEPVLVYSFIEPESFARRLNEVVTLVQTIGKETNQGQMAIEFDGVLYLIDI
jgi:hypothetical protein